MDLQLILCDWAEAIGGKLYIQGAGWTRIRAQAPISLAVAVIARVPYNETNQKQEVTIRLVTEDGQPFPVEDPASAVTQFEVGRPPGMTPGEDTVVPLAGRFNPIAFPAGGYRFEAEYQDGTVGVPFRAVEQLP